jgi:hypothetical protein
MHEGSMAMQKAWHEFVIAWPPCRGAFGTWLAGSATPGGWPFCFFLAMAALVVVD